MSGAEKQNRYEMTNEYWRNIFLQMDCDELAERFNCAATKMRCISASAAGITVSIKRAGT